MSNPKALAHLTTEQRHPESTSIDSESAVEIVELMNREDVQVCEAVRKVKDSIARTIDQVTLCLRNHGRLIYLGAGTSGLDGRLAPKWDKQDERGTLFEGIVSGKCFRGGQAQKWTDGV